VVSRALSLSCVLLVVCLLVVTVVGCGGAEDKELTLTVDQPQDGTTFTVSEVWVRGTVSDAKATVKINDVTASVGKKGTLAKKVTLTEGENTINIVATRGEKVATTSITITYEKPLALEISAPEDNAELSESPVTVSGMVSIPEATVTVNGIEVAVAEDGSYSTSVELAEGENTLTVTATAEGKEPVEESITVTYIPPEETIEE